jgi:hypothetical protein
MLSGEWHPGKSGFFETIRGGRYRKKLHGEPAAIGGR